MSQATTKFIDPSRAGPTGHVHLNVSRPKNVSWTPILLLAWWLSYLASLFLWRPNDPNIGLIATKQGSITNQALICAFGILGIWYGPKAIRRLSLKRSKWLLILLAYTGWSTLSLCWSDDLGLSVRRLGEFVIVTAASLSVGAGYYGRDSKANLLLFKHMLIAAILSAASIVAYSWRDLSLEHFLTPSWDPEVRTIGLYTAYPLNTYHHIAACRDLLSHNPSY